MHWFFLQDLLVWKIPVTKNCSEMLMNNISKNIKSEKLLFFMWHSKADWKEHRLWGWIHTLSIAEV